MKPDTLRPATPEDGPVIDDELEIARLQEEAARKAKTIGSFTDRFHSMVERAFDAGRIQNEALIERQTEAVDAVTDGHNDIAIDTTEVGVLGYNTIGAGRAGMRISRQTLADIQSIDEKKPMKQVVSHELAHGNQVKLVGELEVDGKTVDDLLLYEGHAEVNGNEGAGMSMTDHREGQPEEMYAEGQRLAVMIIRKAGRAAFEKALTKDGDLSALQGAMAV